MSSATESASFSQLDQVINGTKAPSHKWFSLQDNDLGGDYYPIPSDGSGEVGWWGTSLSDGSGSLVASPALTVTFAERDIHGITICGDSLLNEFPVDFTVALYNGVTLLTTVIVSGNTEVNYMHPFSEIYTADKLVLTVTKINKASRTVKILEAYNEYIMVRSDSLIVTPRDAILKRVASTDNLLLFPLVESELIVDFSSADTLLVAISETSTLTNIHSVMNADEREIFGKVEISYSDPYTDESIAVVASETNRVGDAEEIADSLVTPKRKWLSLHKNSLDGTYYPVAPVYSIGWWGNSLSDVNGDLAPQPTLTVTFDARTIQRLRLAGDSLLNNFPVDFTIVCYDAADTVLHTETVIGNASVDWQLDISPIYSVTKMVATISKINEAFSVPKIMEFYTAVKETYTGDEIVSLHLLEELGYSSSVLSLGTISANEISVTLDNTTRKFNIGNSQSSVNGYLKKNRRVVAWLGAEVVPGEIEWYQLGVFYTTNWSVPEQDVVAIATARDRLELLRLQDFTTSEVYTNYTLYQLFGIVFTAAGLVADVDYTLDTALQSVIIPYSWFDRMTAREALHKIASCTIVDIYCNRQGIIVVKQVLPTAFPITTFNEDNLFSKNFPYIGDSVANYVEVKASSISIGVEQAVIDLAETITVPANGQYTLNLTYNQIPCIDVQNPTITGHAAIIVASYNIYAWGVVIVLANSDGSDQEITAVEVLGKPLSFGTQKVAIAQDADLIREDGKTVATVSHDFIQTQVYAQQLATDLLALYKNSLYNTVLDSRGNVALLLGDRFVSPGYLHETDYEYMTTRQIIDWNGSLMATIESKKI